MTLVELAVTMSLIAAVSVAVFVALKPGETATGDLTARGSLSAAVSAGDHLWLEQRQVSTDVDRYSAVTRGGSFIDGSTPSTSAAQVSVAGSGQVNGYAARSGDDCWLMRRDHAAGPGDHALLVTIASAVPCTGTTAVGLDSDIVDGDVGTRLDLPGVGT